MKWDNEPIDTLCVARVAFWNQGKSSLSQDKLPSTDPLRISSSSPIKILSVETVNISRTSLPISYKIKPENKARAKFDDSIVFSIEGNDALEKDDGFAAKLLFTGDCSKSHLSVQGRVKSVGQIKQHEIAITFTTYAIALIFFIILSILYVKMFMHKLQAYNRSLEAAIIGPSLAWVIPLIFWIRILLHALPSWLP